MTVNAIDNSCTARSPCLSCERKNDDKKDCIDRCGRLGAYRNGYPYKHIPRLVKSETAASKTTQKVFPVKSPTPKPESWAKTLLKNQKQAEKLAKPAKIALPKVVAVPVVKQKIEGSEVDRLEAALEKSGGKCLICLDRTAIRRGLCLKHYCRWRKGQDLHPIFNGFRVMTLDELSAARNGRYTKCLMPSCTGLGERRKLCSKCYKKWYNGLILHPILGVFKSKNKKASMNKTNKKIVIDFNSYEKLFVKLQEEADKGLVSVEHKIISLIAEKLQK